MNNELESVWKEVVIACFKVAFAYRDSRKPQETSVRRGSLV